MASFLLGLLLLMWTISIKGAGEGCPSPPATEFAEFFVESYKVGTKVKYECVKGYKRPSGKARNIKCSSDQDGFGRWTPLACIVDPSLPLRPSTPPTIQTLEENGRTDGSPTTDQPLMKDFCGVHRLPKQARAVSTTYAVGQELLYRCMAGYRARETISAKITCQDSGVWSSVDLRCTNNTMLGEEDVTPETGRSGVSSFTSDTHFGTLADKGTSENSNFPFGIYRASAVFVIAMVATVVIM